MIDLITSYVFNGSITGFDTYMAWLPFYDYGYYVIALFTISLICSQFGNRFFKNVFNYLLIASILSLPVLYALYYLFYPTPDTIYMWWIGIQFIIYVTVAFINSMFRFSEFETKEEYFNHIKKEHPDIYEKYHKDNEENEH